MANKLRLMLLISGGGTTAVEIIRACKTSRLQHVEPVGVIASRSDAPGIQKVSAEGTQPFLAIRQTCATDEQFGEHILRFCQLCKADWIGQYGWMPKTPANVIDAFPGRMINQHPGPLDPGYPDFGGKRMYGRRVHAARLHFVRATKRDFWTEAVAQFVAPEFDQGAVIHRQTVQITPGDDPIELQQRVLPVEHQVQIEALEMVSDGRIADLTRRERLVRPDEETTLTEAKRAARLLFPHG